jgi:hypothetical protein
MQLTTVRLLVSDFPALFVFWRDVMQLPVGFGPDMPGGVPGYAYFTAGEAALELLRREAFAQSLGEAP